VVSELDIPIDDCWYSRDLPVLREAARQAAANNDRLNADTQRMATAANTDTDGVEAALKALEDGHYVSVLRSPTRADGHATVWGVEIRERGRRTVGIWPNQQQPVDRLLEALRQAEEHTSDEDDRTALAKAGRYLASLPRDIVAEVIASVLT
jgi:hypothetical protein